MCFHSTTDGGDTWTKLAVGAFVNRFRVLGPGRVYACGQKVYRWGP